MTENSQRKIYLDQRALILNEDGQILLIREESDSGWDLPGEIFSEGGNWRESLEDYISEELELQIVTKNPVYAADFVHPETGEYTYMSVVVCLALDDEFNDDNFSRVNWFNLKDLTDLQFNVYEIREAIMKYLSKDLE